jgi:hypothetical protein
MYLGNRGSDQKEVLDAMGLVELLVLFAAVSGSAWIVGTVAWLWYRTKRLEDRILHQAGSAPHLASELHDLKIQLQASNEEVDHLQERMDFLERLLSEGDRGAANDLGRRDEVPQCCGSVQSIGVSPTASSMVNSSEFASITFAAARTTARARVWEVGLGP